MRVLALVIIFIASSAYLVWWSMPFIRSNRVDDLIITLAIIIAISKFFDWAFQRNNKS